MTAPARPAERLALRLLDPADRAMNRLYGSRFNPLYHSGAIVVALLGVLIVSGLWLLLFWRVGAPYTSVTAITEDRWIGNWLRGVHRYASDGVVVATAVHAFRMFAQGRSWGARALAWMSGVVMVGLIYVCGLTGYVMVWDAFGLAIAQEGARIVDALPVLSEPVSRAFAGEEALLGPFFFLNMFAHIAIPLGLALVLWLHVSRVARPTLLPPRRLTWVLVVGMIAAALVRPLAMQPAADAFNLPASVEADVFYGFWLPLTRGLPAGAALLTLIGLGIVMLLVPVAMRRRGTATPPPSVVDEDVCTGCTQCAQDCPYEAITMVAREPGGRSLEVARVDPDLCVSCGICAGSCAPMAVGPAGRTGRDQLALLRRRAASEEIVPGAIVVVCCDRSSRGWAPQLEQDGAVLHPVSCAGSMHTSVVELLIRGGAGGVLVLSCPPRDCWNREGPKWLMERMYHDREAELKPRVDRRRVRVAEAAALDVAAARAAFRTFRDDIRALDAATAESEIEIDLTCYPESVETGA